MGKGDTFSDLNTDKISCLFPQDFEISSNVTDCKSAFGFDDFYKEEKMFFATRL